jgi:hypothetical protein
MAKIQSWIAYASFVFFYSIIIIMKSRKIEDLTLELNGINLIDSIEQKMYRARCFIDRYEITDEVGSGAFASVYRCKASP